MLLLIEHLTFARALCCIGRLRNSGFALNFSSFSKAPNPKLTNVRVRFAPSPTGYLHLGGFRTALLNYLFALKHDGKFILRIEDTDQSRLVSGALEKLEKDLEWLEIIPNESPSKGGLFGPYLQSARLGIYQKNIETLLSSGHAYECFCTETRLDLIRREAIKLRQSPRYDNKCRDLTRDQVVAKKAAGIPHCIRFKLNQEIVQFDDLIHGNVKFDLNGNNYEGDPVILKTDGYPTYHFANVVDDHFMEISHVLRGIEWQVSTPKHLQLYSAFKWSPPYYGHLPLVCNTDGTKLSKRQGDISIQHYRDATYYPRAIANFVTKSGGGFSDHLIEKIYSNEQLATQFDLNQVNTNACKLDFDLLKRLNRLELKNQIENKKTEVYEHLVKVVGEKVKGLRKGYVEDIIKWCPDRVSKISDLKTEDFNFLWSTPDATTYQKIKTDENILIHLTEDMSDKFLSSNNDNPSKDEIISFFKQFCLKHGVKQKLLFLDLRLLLCGLQKGPPIAELVDLFGVNNTCLRIHETLRKGKQQVSSQAIS